jgi:hypothetical protein
MSQGSTIKTGNIISSRFPDCPNIEVGLQEKPQQFGSLTENKRFNRAMLHLPGYLTDKPGNKSRKLLTGWTEHLAFHRIRHDYQQVSLGYGFPRYIPTTQTVACNTSVACNTFSVQTNRVNGARHAS